ncbi:MAG: GNAT family N-acetyltransferase [Desulfobacteraceae bacterium]|jgi:ribosomal protein S18 acetylase RimI-like enzyme|nr:GNAT family N-acetyltransferase [Desulfobacteraceae bacterium]
MKIFEVTEYKEFFLDALNRLLPQLSSSAEPLTKTDLMEIIKSRSTKLLFAEDNSQISGILTLVFFKIPTGTRAWIEDVIVDSETRSKGVGNLLVQHAIKLAKEMGAETIDLTSHPLREPANRLYQKLDFEIRKTNVYRYTIYSRNFQTRLKTKNEEIKILTQRARHWVKPKGHGLLN